MKTINGLGKLREIVAACVVGMFVAGAGWAGSLDSPAAPTEATSAMFTLDDIYNKVENYGTNVAKRTGAFKEPAAGPTSGTMHTLNEIMGMITNRARVFKTGQTAMYSKWDDGEFEKGGVWPNPRFTDNGDETITDNLTGLMWTKNATNNQAAVAWATALTNAHNCAVGGYTDWRLPNRRELESLLTYGRATPAVPNTVGTGICTEGDPFTGTAIMTTANQYYWSSTTRVGSSGMAWKFDMKEGLIDYAAKTTAYYVWPVRGPR